MTLEKVLLERIVLDVFELRNINCYCAQWISISQKGESRIQII
jgi:hypothetical protein